MYEKGYLSHGISEENHIRFWLKGAPIPAEKEGVPLKKIHFKNGKRVLIQILETPDRPLPVDAEQKRTILYIYHRNPETREFDVINEFSLISGKVATWRNLVDQLSAASGIPTEHLLVAFFDRRKKQDGTPRWYAVDEEQTWTERAFLVDIFSRPYSVMDGDNFGLMDRREDPQRLDRPAGWEISTDSKSSSSQSDPLDLDFVRTPSKMRSTQEAVLRISIE